MELSKKIEGNYKFSNNHLHLHTDASLADGAQTVKEALDRLKANGATAAAITDHGLCCNWLDFYNYAKKIDIKPILGVEAYIETDIDLGLEDKTIANEHLVLLAKDYLGFQQISRFVSGTNRNLKMIAGNEKAVGNMQMLWECFGPNAKDSGHVICLSACIAGPLAQPFSYNFRIDREIEKINKRINSIKKTFTDEYFDAKAIVDSVNERIAVIDAEIKRLDVISKKKFGKIEKELKKMEDGPKKEFLNSNLVVEKLETEKAKETLEDLRAEKKELREKTAGQKKILTSFKEKTKNIKTNEEKIQAFEKLRKTEKEMYDDASLVAKQYLEIFGKDFYAEVQYHGISQETFIYPKIADLAREQQIPIVATNDAHMATKDDLMKRILLINSGRISRQNPKWFTQKDGDEELYIKTGDEIAEALIQILPEDVVVEAMRNIDVICDQCDIFIDPSIKHYPKFDNAKELLRDRCEKGILLRYPKGIPESYKKQMEYELGIIDKMGYNDYFCEVIDFIDYAKESADCSIEIGPGRGSGAGSIVCYLTGITELDPMNYNLMFERFLNPERVSMPDIDTDFSAHARKICIAYVKKKYGERSIAMIQTKGKMAARKSLDYAGKLYGLQFYNDKAKYTALVKDIKEVFGTDPKATLDGAIKENKFAKFADNKTAATIIQYACKMENYITSYGTHAAGVIIGDGTDIENYIPLIASEDKDKNPVFAVQADMVQCEAQLGFIKMDFLGLKNLNIITDAMRMIRDNYGVTFDPYNLPFEPEVFLEIYAKGDTNFVFQFESSGMKKMLIEFKPMSFKDIILLVACYRPGPMDFIPDIIHAKETGEPSEFVKRFPVLKPVLQETYGYPVYQEEVMKIMMICASFSTGKADNVRRHMSKKHMKDLEAMRPEFIEGCSKNGINADDANWLYDQLMPFGRYAFNKSHAATYALVSYMTAWLKYHYFKEYICAAITTQDKKTAALNSDCKDHNVMIYRPDINDSDVHFTPYKDGIIFGLSAIKGTKAAAEMIVTEKKEHGPFASAEDFMDRVKLKANDLYALIMGGAFDSFTNNREAFSVYLADYAKNRDEIREQEANITTLKEAGKDSSAAEKKIIYFMNIKSKLQVSTKAALSTKKRLAAESEYLGMWVTGNPMEDYDVSAKKYTAVSEIEQNGKYCIPGVVTEFKKIFRKSDGAEMCQFTLVDKNGSGIRCCCFVAEYAKFHDLLVDGTVIAVNANANEKEMPETDVSDMNSLDDSDDSDVSNHEEPEKVFELIIKNVVKLHPADKILTILTHDVVQKAEDIVPLIQLTASDEGYICKVYDQTFREIQTANTKVDPEIIERLEKLHIDYICA